MKDNEKRLFRILQNRITQLEAVLGTIIEENPSIADSLLQSKNAQAHKAVEIQAFLQRYKGEAPIDLEHGEYASEIIRITREAFQKGEFRSFSGEESEKNRW